MNIDFSKVDQLPDEFIIRAEDRRIPPLVFVRCKDVRGVVYEAVLCRRPRGERELPKRSARESATDK